MPTRREVLAGLGTAAAGSVAVVGTASGSHPDRQPEHVSITYDSSTLERYKPLLDIEPADRKKLVGLYGWLAESPEYDTAVCVFWCSYTHQEPPWWAPTTGHYGDHEPVAVEFDPDSGDVVRVRASIYHWIKGEITGSAMPLDGTNPTLRVVNPHHQYTAQPDAEQTSSFEVQDLTANFESWLTNGLEESLQVGACYEPWIMREESDWWAPGKFGLSSTEQIQARAARSAGFGVVGDLSD